MPSNCEETLLESRQIDLMFDDMLRDREQQRLRQLETTPAGADEDYSHIPTLAHQPAATGVPAERTKVDWHGMAHDLSRLIFDIFDMLLLFLLISVRSPTHLCDDSDCLSFCLSICRSDT